MPQCHAPGVCKFAGIDNDERIVHLSLRSGHFNEVARVTGYHDERRPNKAEAIWGYFVGSASSEHCGVAGPRRSAGARPAPRCVTASFGNGPPDAPHS